MNRFIFVLLCDKMGLTYPSCFLCRKALAHQDGSFLLISDANKNSMDIQSINYEVSDIVSRINSIVRYINYGF